MPTCPNGHGSKTGKHCDECGASLSDLLPLASGEGVRVRSPEATAIVNFTPNSTAKTRPQEVECPRCGKFNARRGTFNCKGTCDRSNLCLDHFDKEYEVCLECAQERRGTARAEAERQAKIQADLNQWREQAEQAAIQVANLTSQLQQSKAELAQTVGELQQSQSEWTRAQEELQDANQRVAEFEREQLTWQQLAEASAAELVDLTLQVQKGQDLLIRAETQIQQAQQRAGLLENDLAASRLQVHQADAQSKESSFQYAQIQVALKKAQVELSEARQNVATLEQGSIALRQKSEQAMAQIAELTHELQVGQALWSQSDERIREAQREVEAARRRADDLYEQVRSVKGIYELWRRRDPTSPAPATTVSEVKDPRRVLVPPVPLSPPGAYLDSVTVPGLRMRIKDNLTTIGRGLDCDIRITEKLPNWETVSRHHAEIRREGGVYVIYDVSNKNGLYVQGLRTAKNLLRPGTPIAIGGVEFVFHDSTATGQ